MTRYVIIEQQGARLIQLMSPEQLEEARTCKTCGGDEILHDYTCPGMTSCNGCMYEGGGVGRDGKWCVDKCITSDCPDCIKVISDHGTLTEAKIALIELEGE